MKITGTSSYIKVEYKNKTVKIQGELMVGGFLAYVSSIKNWDWPDDDTFIDEATKSAIINAVIKKTENSYFVIKFE
jgi:hypothetical protein